jgi:prepilin-type N-terminal cleavage/methylation domain-containing protein
MNRLKKDQHGFTIIELMVALTVLSTLLLLSTFILIQLGNIFSKGVNTAAVENATRTVAGELTSTLQFSGIAPDTCNPAPQNTCYIGGPLNVLGDDGSTLTIYAYCINNVRYSYVMDREQGKDTDPNNEGHELVTPHVLWRDTMLNNTKPCVPLNISHDKVVSDDSSAEGSGHDSKGHEMAPNRTRLTRFLVQRATDKNVYNISVGMAYGDSDLVHKQNASGDYNCISGKGSEYCANSQISSTVTRRVVDH